MTSAEEHQRQATRIILATIAPVGFALAGSGAIREHGLTHRPTHDVDLFTPAVPASVFRSAVEQTVTTLAEHGYTPELHRAGDQFARLLVATRDGYLFEVDLGVDWRAHDPVWMDIGPVLAVADAVANKVCALFSRAEPRDFLDVDAIRQTGIFSDSDLLTIAAEHDPGFDVAMFATQLGAATRLTPEDVSEYRVSHGELNEVTRRFLAWRTELIKPSMGPEAPWEVNERINPIPRHQQHDRHESIYRRPTQGPGISP